MELMRKINMVIGYILLTPGILSVFYFFKGLYHFSGGWISFYTGFIDISPINNTITELIAGNPIPVYISIMTIAGAYLITANLKTNENGNANTGD